MMPTSPTGHTHPWGDAATPYEEIGGEGAVRSLVETFYDTIEGDSPVLRAMLPNDTKTSRAKLFEYLSGWLGGPPLYTDKRGHPQLRRRHLPFPIGTFEAEEWMRCMESAIAAAEIEEPCASFLIDRFRPLALHMRNQE